MNPLAAPKYVARLFKDAYKAARAERLRRRYVADPKVDELARMLGFCLACCDGGTVGAQLADCDHE